MRKRHSASESSTSGYGDRLVPNLSIPDQKGSPPMEAGKSEDRRERVTDDLRKAMEDLRVATRNATDDVRSGIESAVSRLRDASSTATREELDTFRDRLRSATANLLDDIEKEARKRREQLQGEGAKAGAAKPGGEEAGAAKPGGEESGGTSGSPNFSGSS